VIEAKWFKLDELQAENTEVELYPNAR